MYIKKVIQLRTIYIDICENFLQFYRLQKNRNKKFKRIYYIQYKIYNKLHIIKKIEIKNRVIYILFSLESAYIRKLEELTRNAVSSNIKVILSTELMYKLGKMKSKYNIDKCVAENENNKEIFKKSLETIIKDVLKLKKKTIQEINIYILIKELKSDELIMSLAKQCKTLNIITSNMRNFRRLEDYIYNNYGIAITVSNNKKKGLLRANYIINIDYNEDEINLYNINRNAIIFNISYNKIKNIKCFEGLIINNIFPIYKVTDFKNYYSRKFREIEILNNKDSYKIIGNNGYISSHEIGKNLY